MKWRVIKASVRGSAHQRTGLPNQDAVDYGTSSQGEASLAVLAVSDGHGSGRHFRSQVGSTLAVHVAVQTARETMAKSTAPESDVLRLTQEMVSAWLAAVRTDLSNNPFTEAELKSLEETDGGRSRVLVEERPELAYGATLLVAIVTEGLMLLLQLGDGDILTVTADGTTSRPIVHDERLVGNQTTSLCQPEAWREFRMAEMRASEGLPVLVLLSSDGYLNSFRSEADFLQIGRDYLEILREQGSEALAEELPRILSEATQQGSGDDITLGILHAEVIPAKVPGFAAPIAAREAQGGAKSVLIRQLTEERSTQQQKLTELESHYAGARRHMLQLRLLIGVALLAAVAGLTKPYWMPLIRSNHEKIPAVAKHPGDGVGEPQKRPAKGTSKPEVDVPGEPVHESPVTPENPSGPDGAGVPIAKPAAGQSPVLDPEVESEVVLALEGGVEVILSDGKAITASAIVGGDKKQVYARVKKRDNVLLLTNLSSDAWTVTLPGKGKSGIFKLGDNVPLRSGTKIVFQKTVSGMVMQRSHAS